MDLTFSVLADEPGLLDILWDMETSWPEFMLHDPVGNSYYSAVEVFDEHVVVGLDNEGAVAAKAFSVPFRLGSDDLPEDGWDGAAS